MTAEVVYPRRVWRGGGGGPPAACAEDVRAAAAEGERLWVDADKVSVALVTAAEESVAAERAPKVAKKGAEEDVAAAGKSSPVKEGVSPIPLAKAVKNEAELAGMMEAHLRDGVAMASFWCWLDKQAAEGKEHDEYEIGEVVSSFRARQPGFSEGPFRHHRRRGTQRRRHPLSRHQGERPRGGI